MEKPQVVWAAESWALMALRMMKMTAFAYGSPCHSTSDNCVKTSATLDQAATSWGPQTVRQLRPSFAIMVPRVDAQLDAERSPAERALCDHRRAN